MINNRQLRDVRLRRVRMLHNIRAPRPAVPEPVSVMDTFAGLAENR